MTKDKVRSTEEALKLALEALEKSHTCPLLPDDCAEAITAIKEALMSDTDGAQPEQEPVGQLLENAFGRGQVMWFNKPKDESMLYTTPPPVAEPHKRKPLSDEEFRAILRSLSRQQGWDGDGWDLALKEAIEAAHGIKGEA